MVIILESLFYVSIDYCDAVPFHGALFYIEHVKKSHDINHIIVDKEILCLHSAEFENQLFKIYFLELRYRA